MSEPALSIWTIYNNPRDCPGLFIARRHEVHEGYSASTEDHIVAETLEHVRGLLCHQNPGLFLIPRDPNDDPCVVESWI